MSDFLIWSHEHGAWWRPHRRGYTSRINNAGIYGEDDARAIIENATHNWQHDLITPNEPLPPWGDNPPEVLIKSSLLIGAPLERVADLAAQCIQEATHHAHAEREQRRAAKITHATILPADQVDQLDADDTPQPNQRTRDAARRLNDVIRRPGAQPPCSRIPTPGQLLQRPCPDCGHLVDLHIGCQYCPVCEVLAIAAQLRTHLPPEENQP